MKALFKYFLVFFVFTVEVKVKAAQANDKNPSVIQEPKSCLQDQFLCAIYNKSKNFYLPMGGQKVTLGKKTGVVRESNSELQLLTGILSVKTEDKIDIKTEFGNLYISNGEVLVKKSKSQVQFVAIEGQVFYQPKGEKNRLLLPPAFENFMGAVNNKGLAQSGFSHATMVKKWIPIWSSVFMGDTDAFKLKVYDFKEKWQVAVDQAPEWYRQIVDRRLAEAENRRQRRAAYMKRRKEENKHLRELFRKKNYVF